MEKWLVGLVGVLVAGVALFGITSTYQWQKTIERRIEGERWYRDMERKYPEFYKGARSAAEKP